jgi:nucleoside-diphosphate-sugar epimerase
MRETFFFSEIVLLDIRSRAYQKLYMKILIFGFGFTSKTCSALLKQQSESIVVTVRSKEKRDALREQGLDAYCFNGFQFDAELTNEIALATHIIVSAPPDDAGDPTLRCFMQHIQKSTQLQSIIYLSTIGVYGNFDGAWIDETTKPNAVSLRATRRLEAEQAWLNLGHAHNINTHVLRLAGIYGAGRNALTDFANGKARRIFKENQVFNRIHVDDIARVVKLLIDTKPASNIWNICDHEPCPPQDVVLYAAHLLGVEAPPLQAFETAELTEMGRAFYSENKRVSNKAVCEKLGFEFNYPTYREGLKALLEQGEGREEAVYLRTKR